MVHCDNNYTVVSGLAEDFLWEVSGCSCDDASLKMGGGPLLNCLTGCFRGREGWPSFPLTRVYIHTWAHAHTCWSEEPTGWVIFPMRATSVRTQDIVYVLLCTTVPCLKYLTTSTIYFHTFVCIEQKVHPLMQKTIGFRCKSWQSFNEKAYPQTVCSQHCTLKSSCTSALFCHCLLVSPMTLDVLLSHPHRHIRPTLVSQRPCSPIVSHPSQSWPRPRHCRGLFLFIMGGFPPLVLLLFASASSFHSLTSSLLPVCATDQWSSQG